MEQKVDHTPAVGSRFLFEGHFGTIRYVGEVPPTEGLWFGVEWDEPSRGKHSGIHEGVQFFSCKVPNSGSFLRPKRVNLGTTFIEAVQERYGGSLLGKEEEEEMFMGTKVEIVGWDKVAELQSRLDQLCEVSVREMMVSSAGPPGQVATTTPNITKLDLSQNPLLSNWEVVSDVASQLKLTSLQLSENVHLSLPADPLQHVAAFTTLRALYVIRMAWTWNEVSIVLKMTPNLEELHACENRITEISDGENLPQNLTLLNLEENGLSWPSVLKLQALPKLKGLILNDNKLESIKRSSLSPESFGVLESLSVSRTAVNDWESVNALASLPSLTELKFKENPLNAEEPVFTMRQLLISRMAGLGTLNSSQITIRERQLAERYYLKRYAPDFISSQSSDTLRSDFLQLHPQYSRLISVHGSEVVEMGADTASFPLSALKDTLISVSIKCPNEPDQREIIKKLPGSMTVQKLKGLLQRLYKVNSSVQKLSYQDQQGKQEINLSDDLRQLSFYSIRSGDTVFLRW